MADLEGALKKLDRLTQEEARMALAEVLRLTHSVRDEVKVVDGKVEGVSDKVEDVGDKVDDVGDKVDDVGDKVEDVGEKVEDIGDKVEDIVDKVQSLDEKLQVVINGGRGMSIQSPMSSNSFTSDSTQARVEAQKAKSIIQQTANTIDEVKCS